MAHEIGHNLGASNSWQRDFKTTSTGEPCGVLKGFMRSYSPPWTQEWSPCTRQEMAHYRQHVIESSCVKPIFCLKKGINLKGYCTIATTLAPKGRGIAKYITIVGQDGITSSAEVKSGVHLVPRIYT